MWLIDFIMKFIGKINWDHIVAKRNKGKYYELTTHEWSFIYNLLSQNYYIILTWRNNHLSSYLTALASLITSGKWGLYSHALMNLENEVTFYEDFRLVEATSKGVHYSYFDQVFDCDRVCILRPKGVQLDDWNLVMDSLRLQIGKKYDSVYDFKRDNRLSCTELVRTALKVLPNYYDRFSEFEKLFNKKKRILPDDFLNCSDFEVIYYF